MTIITNIEIEVEADCEFTPGSEDHFDRNHGNWLPGDPPNVKNLKVYLRRSNSCIEITHTLPKLAISQIIEQIIEEGSQGEDVA